MSHPYYETSDTPQSRERVKVYYARKGCITPSKGTFWVLTFYELQIIVGQTFGRLPDVSAVEEVDGLRPYQWMTYAAMVNSYKTAARRRTQQWETNGTQWPGLDSVLCELVVRGVLPEGVYLLHYSS